MAKEDVNMGKLDEAQKNIDELKELALEYADDASEEGKCKLRKLQKDLRVKSEELMEDMMPILEKYRDSGKVIVHKVKDRVTEKPLASILVAFGIGIIIGKLCDKGRR